MTAEQIRKAREKAPFKPFTIFLSDQRHFEILHQDFAWIVPGGRRIGIADEHGAVEIVDLVHVKSLRLNDERIGSWGGKSRVLGSSLNIKQLQKKRRGANARGNVEYLDLTPMTPVTTPMTPV